MHAPKQAPSWKSIKTPCSFLLRSIFQLIDHYNSLSLIVDPLVAFIRVRYCLNGLVRPDHAGEVGVIGYGVRPIGNGAAPVHVTHLVLQPVRLRELVSRAVYEHVSERGFAFGTLFVGLDHPVTPAWNVCCKP